MLVADVVLLLAVGAVALLAGRALGLPAIVACLVAGVLVGPGGAGLVPRSDAVSELAELGVALLLFGVGIEFSLDRLRRILPRMVASGALQMAGTIGATALGFGWLGLPWPAALLTGFLVSLSSTAIVFKVYGGERGIDRAGRVVDRHTRAERHVDLVDHPVPAEHHLRADHVHQEQVAAVGAADPARRQDAAHGEGADARRGAEPELRVPADAEARREGVGQDDARRVDQER